MKLFVLASLLAVSPCLVAMVKDQSIVSKHSHTLEVLKTAATNIASRESISQEQLKQIAKQFARRLDITELEVIIHLFDFGISQAAPLLESSRSDLEAIIHEFTRDGLHEPLVLPLLRYDPSFASDPLFLGNALIHGSASLVRFLVDRPELREIFVSRPSMEVHSPLSSAFPLNDCEKALIIAQAFGLRTVLSQGKDNHEVLSVEVARGLIQHVFDAPDYLFEFLSAMHEYFPTLLNSQIIQMLNERGETILTKLIERRRQHRDQTSSFLKCIIRYSDIDATDSLGETALIKAAKNGDLEIVEHLRNPLGDQFHRDARGLSALDHPVGQLFSGAFSNPVPQTYLELLPRDVLTCVILPSLLSDTDIMAAIRALVSYYKTLKGNQEIHSQQLELIATLIADRFHTTRTEVMLRFYGLGISEAERWLRARSEITSATIKRLIEKDGLRLAKDLVLPIYLYDPSFFSDPAFIKIVLRFGQPELLQALVQCPRINHLILKPWGTMSEPQRSLLRESYNDLTLERVRILVEAFGLKMWVSSGLRHGGVKRDFARFSPEVVQYLISVAFKDSKDLAFLVHTFGCCMNPQMLDIRNERGETMLMKLVESRPAHTDHADEYLLFLDRIHKKSVRLLITHSNVNATDALGETALIKATKKGDLKVIGLLLDRGTDTFHSDARGLSAIDYARGNPPVQQLFADKLHIAIEELFPPQEVGVNARGERGETALITATRAGDTEAVRSLLAHDVDPFIEDFTRATAIDYARGNPVMEQLFAEKLGVGVGDLFLR